MNVFKENYLGYINKRLSVIPDKWASKQAGVKDYSKFSYELPSENDLKEWVKIPKTNIALCLGESSKIIALDVDTENQQILDLILPSLPNSPVEKIGAKGFTRFFKYNGEHTQLVKHNREVVFEILSNNKKTTLPPSRHPSGVDYKWSSDKTLLDINVDELPTLPPFLVPNIESLIKTKFPDTEIQGRGKTISGRNNQLSSKCAQLISDQIPVDQAIKELIAHDKEFHEIPLFTDPEEMRHTEPFTNALMFYTNHLCTINTRHYRKKEEYEIPITASAVSSIEPKKIKKIKNPRTCTCPLCKKDFTLV